MGKYNKEKHISIIMLISKSTIFDSSKLNTDFSFSIYRSSRVISSENKPAPIYNL